MGGRYPGHGWLWYQVPTQFETIQTIKHAIQKRFLIQWVRSLFEFRFIGIT